MNVEQAYNTWAQQYDTNENKTRDLEARSLRESLEPYSFDHCLEIGCGTGKNTEWLIKRGKKVTAVDLSPEMLALAKQKINSDSVEFIQANIKNEWSFAGSEFDMVTFSLVLEHIKDLDHIFKEVSGVLRQNGLVYVGELHPYKQYAGSKARFETTDGVQVVECYNHDISEFIHAATKYGLRLHHLNEYFDEDQSIRIPRILTLLFKKTDAI